MIYKNVISITETNELKYGNSYRVLLHNSIDSITVVNEYGYGKAYSKQFFAQTINPNDMIFKDNNLIDVIFSEFIPDRLMFTNDFLAVDPDTNIVWYKFKRESDKSICWVTIDWLLKHGRDHNNTKIYKQLDICNLYEEGYRWSHNIHVKNRDKFIKDYKINNNIEDILLHTAYYPDGTKKKWHYSIWIKYKDSFNGKFHGINIYNIGGK